uniref:alginate lyase family protein n=1 Tax=uncultured Polaribacter sp. TaxID=174711 RepID=UPI002618C23D|nr:alginate lyase family protein [uncultured Polaribacter sp.]
MRYVFFRIFYTIKTKLGWQKKTFPIQPDFKEYTNLKDWKENLPPFFFYGKEIKGLNKIPSEVLKNNFEDLKKGKYIFFNKTKIDLGVDYDWLTNPLTNYKYDIDKHWSEIQDLSSEAGDIKYVWEKARFSFLYDIIRYDYHFNKDESEFVFKEIEDFIDKNPINQGPNYKCSQETSLRVLNWTFALYYYKDSVNLTSELFNKITHSIYWQIHHVYHNIHFSRITVRNNHAITETLMLYLSEKLFPFFPNVKKWSIKGKKWFEQEIAYQIYEDGTFLQFSMNYHRVVIQLLTWGIQLAKLNNDKFKPVVYERAKKSLYFLDASKDPITGKLPNYGSNDGALFFKLTDDDYRVYTSQLDDLRAVLEGFKYSDSKSSLWYGVQVDKKVSEKLSELNNFEKSGYYIIQDDNTKTFIRCGGYKDRPFQSDNLHLDIWANGINYLRDTGSYKYNAAVEDLNYFNGVEGHNTVSVSKENQMLKGDRFIWYYWVSKAKATLANDNKTFKFTGTIKAYQQINNKIEHQRKITKPKGDNFWKIKDTVTNIGNRKIYQYWHLNPKYFDKIEIVTKDKNDKKITPLIEEKWFSGYYGFKEKSIRLTFATKEKVFNTTIRIHN